MASVVQWHTRRVAASGLLLFYVFRRRNSKKRWRNRKVWVKPYIARNPFLSVYNTLVQELRAEDKAAFKNFFADGSSFTFDELLEMVLPLIQKQDTNMRQSNPAGEKLALTLRYLATVECFFSCYASILLLAIHIFVGLTSKVMRSSNDQKHPLSRNTTACIVYQHFAVINKIGKFIPFPRQYISR